MSERVMEIIALIVNQMNACNIEKDDDDLRNLSQELANSGYTENEINFAFSLLLEKAKISSKETDSRIPLKQSHRIFHDFEKIAISPEAQGYLIQLCEFDLIDHMEMEQIIEKAVLSNSSPVSVSEMKEIVASTIFKPEDVMESSFFVLDNAYNVH